MASITYEDLPYKGQHSFKANSTLRKVLVILGWAITLFLEVWAIIDLYHGWSDVDFIHEVIFFDAFAIGGLPLAVAHAWYYSKNAFVICWVTISFPINFFIAYMAWAAVTVIGAIGGIVFLIIDTILFIRKKPLIYPFEMKHFLDMEYSDSKETMCEIRELNKMLKQGMITQEEYDSKKAELLELI